MLEYCGVDAFTSPAPRAPSARAAPDAAVPGRDWGADTSSRTGPPRAWPDCLATTPYSPAARDGIARIQTDTTTDWIAASTARGRRAEEGDPLAAHAQALPDGLRRRAGAGDPPVPAQRPLAARRRRAGDLRRRHVGARRPGLRRPRASRTRRSPASAARRRWASSTADSPCRVAGRQRVAAAAAGRQADPRHVSNPDGARPTRRRSSTRSPTTRSSTGPATTCASGSTASSSASSRPAAASASRRSTT